MTWFEELVASGAVVLTEGAVIERLRRGGEVELDPDVLHAGLVYDARDRTALELIYRSYLDVGEAFGLPMIVSPPTWRASPERVAAAGLAGCAQVNRDGVQFVGAIRQSYGRYARRVLIGGLLGCRGDAYDASEALTEDDATVFHREQVEALAGSGADFVMAATLPAVSEARGIARALAACGAPYVLSFIIRADGTLLDGAPLAETISGIDADLRPRPTAYLVNCVHPRAFCEALTIAQRVDADVPTRVIGLQGNTSRRRPEELDGMAELDADQPAAYAEVMVEVRRRFGTRILGGCCGTDERHIRCVAEGVARFK